MSQEEGGHPSSSTLSSGMSAMVPEYWVRVSAVGGWMLGAISGAAFVPMSALSPSARYPDAPMLGGAPLSDAPMLGSRTWAKCPYCGHRQNFAEDGATCTQCGGDVLNEVVL